MVDLLARRTATARPSWPAYKARSTAVASDGDGRPAVIDDVAGRTDVISYWEAVARGSHPRR